MDVAQVKKILARFETIPARKATVTFHQTAAVATNFREATRDTPQAGRRRPIYAWNTWRAREWGMNVAELKSGMVCPR